MIDTSKIVFTPTLPRDGKIRVVVDFSDISDLFEEIKLLQSKLDIAIQCLTHLTQSDAIEPYDMQDIKSTLERIK